MSWRKFLPLKNELEKNDIKCLLGVIPNCKDSSLIYEEPKKDFFDFIRHCKNYGDAIAQHGYKHLYDSNSSGLLKINKQSEFAGNSYQNQYEKIRKGKEILIIEKVWEPYFMAPGHSFDNKTIEALKKLDFVAITDGYGIFPYVINNILLVPQLISKPINIGFGLQTICVHINEMSYKDIEKLKLFIIKNKNKIIPFKNVLKNKTLINNKINLIFKLITKWGLIIYRLKRIV